MRKGKFILKVVGVIIGGALGSGLWQHILYPGLLDFTRFANKILIALKIGYEDSLYRLASQGFTERHSLFLNLMLFALIATGYVLIFFRLMRRRLYSKEKKETIFSKFILSTKGLIFVGVLTISVVITMFIAMLKNSYVNNVIIYYNTSIKIISPFISDYELKVLKSDFCRITNASDFHNLDAKIKNIATKNKVTLKTINGSTQ